MLVTYYLIFTPVIEFTNLLQVTNKKMEVHQEKRIDLIRTKI